MTKFLDPTVLALISAILVISALAILFSIALCQDAKRGDQADEDRRERAKQRLADDDSARFARQRAARDAYRNNRLP